MQPLSWRTLTAGFLTLALGTAPLAAETLGLPGSVQLDEGAVSMVRARSGAYDAARPERAASDLLAALAPSLGASQRDELRQVRAESDELGQTHVRLQQFVDGLPVVGGELIVHLDRATGALLWLDGRFLAGSDRLTAVPQSSPHAAVEAVRKATDSRAAVKGEPELVYVFGADGRGALAWAVEAQYVDAQGQRQRDRVFVDAASGAEVERQPLLHRALDREVWDAQNTSSEGGRVRVIDEGGSSTDAVAQDAYDFTGDAWSYFQARHAWDSYNNAGSLIRSTVHYSTNYNNAYWDSSDKRLVFGDGDGVSFGPLAQGLDVVAHELAHGVTQSTAGLVYSNESGALNEAMSDIFGAATEARERGQSANTWLVGEDVRTPATAGDALRYMNNPTMDGSSKDYYPSRYTGSSDNGGVHWNSGIANLAFFLASQGGVHPRGVTSVNVRPIGMNAAERIFFRALRFYMGSGETFAQARQHTARSARELFGHNSQQQRAICEAWDAVGVPGARTGECLTVGDGLPAPASVNVVPALCYGLNDADWSAASGATRYEVWASTSSTDFGSAGRVYNGSSTYAFLNVSGTRYIRVKACNASGCGPLSLAYDTAKYTPGCL